MQRVVGAPPVIVETGGFEADLQTWHTPTFLAPLSHQVSAEAPAGTADLARPVPISRSGDYPLLQPPAKPPARVVQRAVPLVAAEPNPTLVAAPQVSHQPVQLPSLPSAPGGQVEPAQDTPARSFVDESAVTEAPILGTSPDPSASTSDEPAIESPAPPVHVWRPQPGAVGMPLREVPGAAQRNTPADAPTGRTPVQRSSVPTSPAHPSQPAAPAQPTLRAMRPTRPDLPLASREAEKSAPAEQQDVAEAPLIGVRPLQRQADEITDEADSPAPVQLSPLGQHSEWVESAQLPGAGTSPFAPAFAPASRPLLGAESRITPDPPELPGAAPLGAAATSGAPQASGPAVQRGIGPSTTSVAQPARQDAGHGAGAPVVQLMRTLPTGSYRTPVIPGTMTASTATTHTRPPTQPPVQRIATTQSPHIPDPGEAAINAGVASRDADGSVVFRSFLDDATSAVKDKASSAASSAVSDARSRATDAASGALTKASDAAQGAVSDATAKVASAAGLPAPAAGAGAAGDLDDLAKKLYDRLRFRLTTELRLDRERSGSVTDLPR